MLVVWFERDAFRLAKFGHSLLAIFLSPLANLFG